MKLQIVLLLSVICLSAINCENVPAFLWGSQASSTYSPALKQFSSDEFLQLVSTKIDDDTVVLVFTENDFSTEDITSCKNSDGETCFKNLKQIHQKTYVPNVQSPVTALKKLAENKMSSTVSINKSEYTDDLPIEAGQIVFVSWDDVNAADDRSDILSKHDELISKFIAGLDKSLNVLVIYTGNDSPSVSRQTRQVKPKQETPSTITSLSAGNQFLAYFTRFGYKQTDAATEYTSVVFTTATLADITATSFTANLASAGTDIFAFKFALSQGYWSVSQIDWNNQLMVIKSAIAVPTGFSFHCSPTVEYSSAINNGFPTIQLEGLQLEALFTATEGFAVFSDSWDCVGFTSAGIWGGLFVTFLMLFILSIGISWIMDIRTMDRFDDAKGKTITINAQE